MQACLTLSNRIARDNCADTFLPFASDVSPLALLAIAVALCAAFATVAARNI